MDGYSFVYVSFLQGDLLFVYVITLKNSVLVKNNNMIL